jgi:hypothetical protein
METMSEGKLFTFLSGLGDSDLADSTIYLAVEAEGDATMFELIERVLCKLVESKTHKEHTVIESKTSEGQNVIESKMYQERQVTEEEEVVRVEIEEDESDESMEIAEDIDNVTDVERVAQPIDNQNEVKPRSTVPGVDIDGRKTNLRRPNLCQFRQSIQSAKAADEKFTAQYENSISREKMNTDDISRLANPYITSGQLAQDEQVQRGSADHHAKYGRSTRLSILSNTATQTTYRHAPANPRVNARARECESIWQTPHRRKLADHPVELRERAKNFLRRAQHKRREEMMSLHQGPPSPERFWV